MKKMIALAALLLLINGLLAAQATGYKVVFDITSKDTMAHKAVIRWVNEISNNNPGAQLEVVFYGQSLDMVVKNKSAFNDAVTKLAAGKTVAFRVCAIALKNHNIDRAELLPGVEVVPDGIYEIISKQKQGWGYIKVAI
jgi:intracellular sulfur oxidation DsrE/DsrF family protein